MYYLESVGLEKVFQLKTILQEYFLPQHYIEKNMNFVTEMDNVCISFSKEYEIYLDYVYFYIIASQKFMQPNIFENN